MRAARTLIGAAVAASLAATVAACGGSGSHPAAAPSSSLLRGSQLQAALLPPSAFGTGVKAGQDAPETYDAEKPDLLAPPTSVKCDQIGDAGTNDGAVSAAAASVDPLDSAGVNYTEGARQYPRSGAEQVLAAVQTQARGDCKSFDTSMQGGGSFKISVTTAPRSGLGDEAFLLSERAVTPTGITIGSDALIARYGSVVIRVTDAGAAEQLAPIDLTAKVKQIAANLKLG